MGADLKLPCTNMPGHIFHTTYIIYRSCAPTDLDKLTLPDAAILSRLPGNGLWLKLVAMQHVRHHHGLELEPVLTRPFTFVPRAL